MHLILRTPALQAHSALRNAQWRAVIAGYTAARYGLATGDPLPTTVAHVWLALAHSTYEQWLSAQKASLAQLMDVWIRILRVLTQELQPRLVRVGRRSESLRTSPRGSVPAWKRTQED